MAHLHSVYDTDPHFSIDPITKLIKNESSKKTKVMQYDHNSERFTFEIPRTVEGHDMSKCTKIEVHYINIESRSERFYDDVYQVEDMQISPNAENEDVVIFSWLVSGNSTQFAGSLNFLIRFSCVAEDGTIEYAWNTDIHKGISVSTGMFNSEAVAERYSDILEQWKQELIDSGGMVIDETLTKSGEAADAKATGDAISKLSEDIDDLKKNGTGSVSVEQIAAAVESYMAENPVEADLPIVSEADNGKALIVVGGEWKVEELPKLTYSEITNSANGTTVIIGE